jgi:hypothetical protein
VRWETNTYIVAITLNAENITNRMTEGSDDRTDSPRESSRTHVGTVATHTSVADTTVLGVRHRQQP